MDDALDLKLPPGCSFVEEHWRPSSDYPEVTTHALRQEGHELVVTTTPPHGQAYDRRWRIVAVHESLARAVLAPLHPHESERHLDLLTHRLVGTQEAVRVAAPISRDPRDPSLLLALFAVLSEVGPELYPSLAPRDFTREELETVPCSNYADHREARQRWAAPSGLAPTTSAPWIAELFGRKAPEIEPGYGLVRHVGAGLERTEVWVAEDTTPLLSVALWAGEEPRAQVHAVLPRHVRLDMLARAFRRLSVALAA